MQIKHVMFNQVLRSFTTRRQFTFCHKVPCSSWYSFNRWKTEGWKTELTFEPTSGFEPRSPGLGIQCLNTRLLIVIDWYRLPYMQTCQVQKNFLLGLKSLKGATMDALEGVNFPNLSSRVLRKWHLSQTHKIVPQDSVFDHVLAVNFIPRIFFNGDAWCKC